MRALPADRGKSESGVRRLTDEERLALREIVLPGHPDHGAPVNDATFAECVRMGWGYWQPPPLSYWCVTPSGRQALRLDDLARAAESGGGTR